MRLRLGLVNEDLAESFGVSPTLCSYSYTLDQTFKQSWAKRWLYGLQKNRQENIYLKYCSSLVMENVV